MSDPHKKPQSEFLTLFLIKSFILYRGIAGIGAFEAQYYKYLLIIQQIYV